MFVQKRRRMLVVVLAVFTLVSAVFLATPLLAGKVITARVTAFSGTSEQGSFNDALQSAVRHATAAAPSDRPIEWKVTRISGMSGGSGPGRERVVVVVEARW